MRAPTGTLLRAGLTAIVSLALVAGCTDDPEPGTLKTPTATPTSTTASPTPTTPEAQIEATMRAYFEAANQMFQTGDVEAVRRFSVPACPCRKITRYVERIFNGGGEFRGTKYSDLHLRVHDLAGGTAVVEATANVSAYKVVDGSGKIVEDSDGGKLHTDYSMVKGEGDTWIIGNAFDLG
jgi:hypothetical protein